MSCVEQHVCDEQHVVSVDEMQKVDAFELILKGGAGALPFGSKPIPLESTGFARGSSSPLPL